jgi:hypothetical protein
MDIIRDLTWLEARIREVDEQVTREMNGKKWDIYWTYPGL